MKAALLSAFVVTAAAMWGIGFYASGAAAQNPVADGYGIISSSR